MKDYCRATIVEFLKLKRTLVLLVVFAVPVMDGLIQFLALYTRDFTPAEVVNQWHFSAQTMAIYWSNMLYPLEIAIITAMVNGYEHSNNNWKILFSLPVNRFILYCAKFTTVTLLLLCSNLILWIMRVGIGYGLDSLKPELMIVINNFEISFLLVCIKIFFASFFVIAFQFWLSIRYSNFSVAVGVGVMGTFIGMVQMKGFVQKFFPWKLSTNTLSSVDGLPELALNVGIFGGIVVLIIGCLHITRRDVL